MKIVEWSAIEPAWWDETVDACSLAWLFHRSGWMGVESSACVSTHSFAVLGDDGSLAALCPLYRRQLGRGSWVESLLDSGHHRHAGFVLRDDLPPQVRKAAQTVGMKHLLEQAQALDVDRVQLSVQNLAPGRARLEPGTLPFWLEEYGFSQGLNIGPQGDFAVPGMATLCADQVVDLERGEDELFAALDGNFRKAVRKARSHDLTFHTGSESAVAEYHALAEVSAQRTGERLAPREVYETVWRHFAPTGKACIFFARQKERLGAGLFLLQDKGGVHYYGGVSHPDFLPLRINNFIHWEAMLWARQQGHRFYRLGPIFPELPADWPVCRVSRFKGEFGGQSWPILQGSLFLHPDRYAEDGRQAVRWRCGLPAVQEVGGDVGKQSWLGGFWRGLYRRAISRSA